MRTAGVKALMREVLEALPKPYTEHVIDDVFHAIETTPEWRQRYDSECDTLSTPTVHTWGGFWIANLIGKAGQRSVSRRKTTLLQTYSILDTDAVPVLKKLTKDEASQAMYAYYTDHKAELPSDIRKHRDAIIEFLLEGSSAEEAFRLVLRPDQHS